MVSRTRQRTREAEAREDLGSTEIRRSTAALLVGGFLATVVGIPLVQLGAELRAHQAGSRASALPSAVEPLRAFGAAAARLLSSGEVRARNRELIADLRRHEANLQEESAFGRAAFPWTQLALTEAFGAGNEGAAVGADGSLFLRTAMDYTVGPPFLSPAALERRRTGPDAPREADPRVAILDLKRQLEARGARLMLVIPPEKQQLQPGSLAPGYAGPVPQNASFAPMLEQMKAAGVEILDLSPPLEEHQRRTGRSLFLKTDAHWLPEASEISADLVAARIRELGLLPEAPPAGYVLDAPEKITSRGDVLTVLRLPPGHPVFPDETVEIHPVRTAAGDAWQPSREADVLLLGNSFSNIFSQAGLGWGASAGFAEQLSYRLQRPLDTVLRNGGSAHATRQMLARELARGRDRLAGKRLVIWQFALRELVIGDWAPVDLTLAKAPATRFLTMAPGRTAMLRGTLAALSSVPRPGTTPYKDQLRSARVIDLEGPDGPLPGMEALVYAWGMTDGRWTGFGQQRVGAQVKMRLRPWADRESELERAARVELDDDELLAAQPLFAEEVLP